MNPQKSAKEKISQKELFALISDEINAHNEYASYISFDPHFEVLSNQEKEHAKFLINLKGDSIDAYSIENPSEPKELTPNRLLYLIQDEQKASKHYLSLKPINAHFEIMSNQEHEHFQFLTQLKSKFHLDLSVQFEKDGIESTQIVNLANIKEGELFIVKANNDATPSRDLSVFFNSSNKPKENLNESNFIKAIEELKQINIIGYTKKRNPYPDALGIDNLKEEDFEKVLSIMERNTIRSYEFLEGNRFHQWLIYFNMKRFPISLSLNSTKQSKIYHYLLHISFNSDFKGDTHSKEIMSLVKEKQTELNIDVDQTNVGKGLVWLRLILRKSMTEDVDQANVIKLLEFGIQIGEKYKANPEELYVLNQKLSHAKINPKTKVFPHIYSLSTDSQIITKADSSETSEGAYYLLVANDIKKDIKVDFPQKAELFNLLDKANVQIFKLEALIPNKNNNPLEIITKTYNESQLIYEELNTLLKSLDKDKKLKIPIGQLALIGTILMKLSQMQNELGKGIIWGIKKEQDGSMEIQIACISLFKPVKKDSEYDNKELTLGMKIEKKHINPNLKKDNADVVSKYLAKHNLDINPTYYSELKSHKLN